MEIHAISLHASTALSANGESSIYINYTLYINNIHLHYIHWLFRSASKSYSKMLFLCCCALSFDHFPQFFCFILVCFVFKFDLVRFSYIVSLIHSPHMLSFFFMLLFVPHSLSRSLTTRPILIFNSMLFHVNEREKFYF